MTVDFYRLKSSSKYYIQNNKNSRNKKPGSAEGVGRETVNTVDDCVKDGVRKSCTMILCVLLDFDWFDWLVHHEPQRIMLKNSFFTMYCLTIIVSLVSLLSSICLVAAWCRHMNMKIWSPDVVIIKFCSFINILFHSKQFLISSYSSPEEIRARVPQISTKCAKALVLYFRHKVCTVWNCTPSRYWTGNQIDPSFTWVVWPWEQFKHSMNAFTNDPQLSLVIKYLLVNITWNSFGFIVEKENCWVWIIKHIVLLSYVSG